MGGYITRSMAMAMAKVNTTLLPGREYKFLEAVDLNKLQPTKTFKVNGSTELKLYSLAGKWFVIIEGKRMIEKIPDVLEIDCGDANDPPVLIPFEQYALDYPANAVEQLRLKINEIITFCNAVEKLGDVKLVEG